MMSLVVDLVRNGQLLFHCELKSILLQLSLV